MIGETNNCGWFRNFGSAGVSPAFFCGVPMIYKPAGGAPALQHLDRTPPAIVLPA
jgi:hypothetical protein